jgi:hypothetical protein
MRPLGPSNEGASTWRSLDQCRSSHPLSLDVLTLVDAVSMWERSLRAADKSPRTIAAYLYALHKLTNSVGNRPIDSVSRADHEALMSMLQEQGLGAATRVAVHRPLRTFRKWAIGHPDVPVAKDPMAGMGLPRVPEKVMAFVTDTSSVGSSRLAERRAGMPIERTAVRPSCGSSQARAPAFPRSRTSLTTSPRSSSSTPARTTNPSTNTCTATGLDTGLTAPSPSCRLGRPVLPRSLHMPPVSSGLRTSMAGGGPGPVPARRFGGRRPWVAIT